MAVKDQKVVIRIGWTDFVLNIEAGIALFKAVETLEKQETRYNNTTKQHEVFISPVEPGSITMQFLSNETYAMGKLLHKADEVANSTKKEGEA